MRYLIILLSLLYELNLLKAAPTAGIVHLSPEYYHPIESLYHSQDQGGHYVYGYATPAITKTETKSADGVTSGGYSYIDADGRLQTVQYTADPIHGFRVAASNLPVEAADVAQARASHLAEFEAIKAERANAAAAAVSVPYFNPVAVPHAQVPQVAANQQLPEPVTDLPEVVKARAEHLAALNAAYRSAQLAHLGYGLPQAPQPVQDLPEVVKARAEHLAAVEKERSLHAQLRADIAISPIPEDFKGHVVPIQTNVGLTDSLPVAPLAQLAYRPEQNGYDAYSYGYIGPHSAKSETQSADGVVQGGYSYIDAFGVVQTVNYIADKGGFRVAATNIPVDKNHLPVATTLTNSPVVSAAAPTIHAEEKKFVVPALYTTEVKY